MAKVVKLKIRKELDGTEQFSVIKLKGNLISKGYTEIIHILDQDEEYHINVFETQTEKFSEVEEFIAGFINNEKLEDIVTFCN